jgi:hypothetical protein
MFHVGVIGATGFIGTPYRQEIRDAADQAKLTCLCARRRDLLEAAGAVDGVSALTDDWREVVNHPDVDVVLVATPDTLHHEAVMASAAAGGDRRSRSGPMSVRPGRSGRHSGTAAWRILSHFGRGIIRCSPEPERLCSRVRWETFGRSSPGGTIRGRVRCR